MWKSDAGELKNEAVSRCVLSWLDEVVVWCVAAVRAVLVLCSAVLRCVLLPVSVLRVDDFWRFSPHLIASVAVSVCVVATTV